MKYEDAKAVMYPIEKRLDELAINPYLFFLRKTSFRLSYFLYSKRITANQVTLISALALFLPALAVCIFPSTNTIIMFALFANFYYFLDVVDGNIARLQGSLGLLGKFYDETLNMLAGALAPLVVLAYLLETKSPWPIVLGAASIPALRTIRRTNIEYWKSAISYLDDRANISKTIKNFHMKAVIVTLNALLIPSLLPVVIFHTMDIKLYLTAWTVFYLAYYLAALLWTLRFIWKALNNTKTPA